MRGENIKEKILDFVRNFYQKNTYPLLLSELGNHIRQNSWILPEGQSLKSFIKAELVDELTIEQSPTQMGAVAVATLENHQTIRQQLVSNTRLIDERPTSLRDVPRTLLIAFCRKLDNQSDRMFYRRSPPYRYEISQQEPGTDFVEIEAKFRKPGLFVQRLASLSDNDKTELLDNINAWMDETNFSLDKRADSASTTCSCALERLLDAQTQAVRKKLLIPGDIAQILLQHD